MANRFLDECIDQVIKHAGHFEELNEEAAEDFAAFLLEEKVEDGGKSRTREEWSASEKFKKEFFARLAFAGECSRDAGIERMEAAAAAGVPATPGTFAVLTKADMAAGKVKVAFLSGTGYCTP